MTRQALKQAHLLLLHIKGYCKPLYHYCILGLKCLLLQWSNRTLKIDAEIGPTGQRYIDKEDDAMLVCLVTLNSTGLQALSQFSGASATVQIAMNCLDHTFKNPKKYQKIYMLLLRPVS